MKHAQTISLLAMTVAMAAASTASAQPTDAETSDDVIVVTATGLSTATSSTKTDVPVIETPQTLSVINRDEIDLRAAMTIADALSYSAGVQAEPSGIDSRTDEVSVRGFGAGGYSSNNNFVDGLRLPAGGGWTRFGFDPYGLEQIEVLKGPSSVLYGQSAPGGIVNMVSKRPTEDAQFNASLQATGYTGLDNWTHQITADLSGSLNDEKTVLGRVVGLARYGDTQVNDVENGRYYISPSLTWKPTEKSTWTILAQYQRDEGGSTFQFLPAAGSYEPSNGQYIENDANIGEVDWNDFDRDQYLIGSFFEHNFTDNLSFTSNMRYTHINTLFRLTVLAGGTVTDCTGHVEEASCIEGATVNRRAVQGDGKSDGFAIDNRFQYRVTSGAVEHVLLGGLDYFHTEWDHYRDLVSLPGLPRGQVDPLFDIFNPEQRGAEDYVENMSPQVYGTSVSTQTGLYVQDQMSVGKLRVSLGGRFDWSEDESENLLTSTNYDTSADEFTWQGGAVYLFDNGLAPYVSYSESFLPQVVDPSSTLNSVLFEPTTGVQYEGGLRYQGGSNVYLTLGAYKIIQENVPTADPDGTLCGRRVCQIQTGEAEISGVEFEGRASLQGGTTFIASLSHQESEVTESGEGIEGNKLTQVPDVLGSFFVDQRVETGGLKGLGFGAGLRYTGKSYGDSNNVFEMDDYTLYDLYVRYDLGEMNATLDGVTLSLNGRNILDERYVVTCGTVQSCFYGQGRVVTARLQYAW